MPSAVRTTRSLLLDDSISGEEMMARNARLGLTERQRELNRCWAFYLSQQYEACLVDWDGKERPQPLHAEAIQSTGLMGNLMDVNSQKSPLPLKYRRPSSPYALVPTIVDRFTGMLFSEKRHPVLRVPGVPDVESLLVSLAEAVRLWPMLMLARTFGGAQGTVVIGAKLVDGRPRIEVHDPRWCEPVFSDAESLVVSSMEKRYYYPKEVRDKSGRLQTKHFWYRRVIDAQEDVEFKPVEVTDRAPVWEVASHIVHGLGFCPVVWAQNLPLLDSLDGLPDCPPFVYDISHQIDMLLSQSVRGTVFSCDPTPVFKTGADSGDDSLQKGAGNALFIGPNDEVRYLEMTGSGAKTALETSRELRALALEMSQCVLENPDIGDRATATEVERAYSLMLVKSGKLREQYSKFVVKPLVVMLLRAIRVVRTTGKTVLLRDKLGGDVDALVEKALGILDPEGMLELEWPRYFEISLGDVAQAVTAAAQAYTAGLLDLEGTARFLSKYLDVKDVPGMLARLKRERADREAAAEQEVLRRAAAAGDGDVR